jgi:hypothetical protein
VTPEEHFDRLAAAFAVDSAVSQPGEGRGFGSSGLRHEGKIFAMLTRGRLVLKLPRARVDSLVDSQDGIRFDGNKGTPMREWFSLDPESTLEWELLAREAQTFVSSSPARRRP